MRSNGGDRAVAVGVHTWFPFFGWRPGGRGVCMSSGFPGEIRMRGRPERILNESSGCLNGYGYGYGDSQTAASTWGSKVMLLLARLSWLAQEGHDGWLLRYATCHRRCNGGGVAPGRS